MPACRHGAAVPAALKRCWHTALLQPRSPRLTLPIPELQSEREDLRAHLRELEAEQRKLEADQKRLRQDEMRTKRKLEALDTLLDLAQAD